jgi:hypothetical protein
MLQNKQNIQSIEIILENISCLAAFSDFTHLVELSVVRCKIDKMEGLNTLTNLRNLWLSENKVSKIEGLEKCLKLEKLILFNNTIAKLENLDNLAYLQVLDVSQNKIEVIEGLSRLQNLQVLNLAMNSIEHVGNRLKSLHSLREVNLSGNRINNVEEIKPLREMTNLKVLYFFDPHYGENPLCKIYNYQTYMLFNFDFLDRFDSLVINDESRKSAVVEFKRKRIYYNMKVKCLKRLFTTVDKLLKAVKNKKKDNCMADLRLLCQFRSLLGEKHQALAEQAAHDWKLKAAEESQLSRVYEEFKHHIKEQLELYVRFINVELESTGNFK